MKNFFINLLVVSMVFTFKTATSQKPPEKFEKVEMEELQSTMCPIDSNAHAYYVFDYGTSYFEYASTRISSNDAESTHKGFQLYFTRQFRIKILDNSAFSWADIKIPLYNQGRAQEELLSLKATTTNLENGKEEKSKLKNSDIIREEATENWTIVKFPMPDVKEGSVIDVKYTIRSDFYFNLREWQFQYTIPVLQSEYHVTIPEYFNYNQTQKGYYPVNHTEDSKQTTLKITYQQRSDGVVARDQSYTNNFNYRENIYNYDAKNVPAFPIEKYLKTPDNYLTKIEFEIASTHFPNSLFESYTTTWEKINNKLLESEYFGNQLKNSGYMKKDIEQIQATNLKGQELMHYAYNFIKNKLDWNGQNRKYITTSLREAYNDGGGNSADINLCLVILLKNLGFDAYPVVLSTRDNGIIYPVHPSLSRFNYVVALVKSDNRNYLMDATEPLSDINLLPVRCINDKGWIVDENQAGWIDLLQNNSYKIASQYKMKLDSDLSFKGQIEISEDEYAAYLTRKKIKKYNDTTEYIQSLQKDNPGLTITDSKLSNVDSTDLKLEEKFDVVINDHTEEAGNLVYFTPLFYEKTTENPFKLDKRQYPVEFDYPSMIYQNIEIEIPEDYAIETLPKSIIINLPDKSARYVYNVNSFGKKILVSSQFFINKVLFLPDEYDTLKKLFSMIVSKQNEKIVLKKN